MPDHASSADPAVQTQIDRLTMLSPGRDVLGLERITALLARLGNPQRDLPPVFHVAGTNGKGSTCAFLRAMIEAAGLKAHVYTSPHLVRFNERIRVAGDLISDAELAPLLSEVLNCSPDIAPSFFEATTAAAFLAFSRSPADAAIVEVGLGGRLDATNVIERPTVCGIAALGIDHEAFLLDPANGPDWPPLERIAWEKAGIAKRGVPLVCLAQPPLMIDAIERAVDAAGATLQLQGRDWHSDETMQHGLVGAFQKRNAALAAQMIRSAHFLDESSIATGLLTARWPGRMQQLMPGPFAEDREVWIDGAHNENAARALVDTLRSFDRPMHLIVGILANKDADAIICGFAGLAIHVTAIQVPGHASHDPHRLADIARRNGIGADVAGNVSEALLRSHAPCTIIMGSLYLAGHVLRLNNELPT